MKKLTITADLLFCSTCGTKIPQGQSKCPNPNCKTNKPILGKNKTKIAKRLKLTKV